MSMYSTPDDGRDELRRDHDAESFTVEIRMPAGKVAFDTVNCPMCGAHPEGHEEDGTPRYAGGWVYVKLDKHDLVASCRCVFGFAYHERSKAAFFDQLPPMAEIEKPMSLVVSKTETIHTTAGEIIASERLRRLYFPSTHHRFLTPAEPGDHPIDFNERAEARREEWDHE